MGLNRRSIAANRARMSTTDLQFASLLCSRLCHDLLSPVGALSNGLELLADENDPEMRARCFELLTESATTSANKLKFFRLAFGAAGGFDDQVGTGEARQVIEGLFNNGRCSVNWMVTPETLDKRSIKMLLNLALIGGEALIRGGTLDIGAEKSDGHTDIVIRASGERIALDDEIKAVLSNPASPPVMTSRTAAAHLVLTMAKEANGEIQFSDAEPGSLLFGTSLRAG